MNSRPIALFGLTAFLAAGIGFAEEEGDKEKKNAKKDSPGYTDTPFLPGNEWRVHDANRPRPEVVDPGENATDPPGDAIVLFDGGDLDEWVIDEDGSPADWTVENGYFEVPPRKKSTGRYIRTKREFGDVQLHIEFATPTETKGDSQGSGNSGVFLLHGYEIQILDSHDNESYADGQASALYGYKPPLVNASRPAGEWQSFDIIFEAPEWDAEGNLLKRAYVTVLHNGVVTHHYQDFLGPTGHKRVANYEQVEERGPIRLQNHRNPVRFRNIWVRELDTSAND